MKLSTAMWLSFYVLFLLVIPHATAAKPVYDSSAYQSEIPKIRVFFDSYMAKYNHYLSTNEFKDTPYLYHDTIMVMSSSVDPYTIDSAAFYKRTQTFLDDLKSKGVERVGWIDVNIRIIDSNLAIASNMAGRYKKNDDEFNRVGVTYMLRKNNNEWRITSFTVHNADSVKEL